jgi:hypothetical protein
MEKGLHMFGLCQEMEEHRDVRAMVLRLLTTRVAVNPPAGAPGGDDIGADGVPNGEGTCSQIVELELEKTRPKILVSWYSLTWYP